MNIRQVFGGSPGFSPWVLTHRLPGSTDPMLVQVGRWVKADDLRLAMDREQKSIHKEEAKGGSEDRCVNMGTFNSKNGQRPTFFPL